MINLLYSVGRHRTLIDVRVNINLYFTSARVYICGYNFHKGWWCNRLFRRIRNHSWRRSPRSVCGWMPETSRLAEVERSNTGRTRLTKYINGKSLDLLNWYLKAWDPLDIHESLFVSVMREWDHAVYKQDSWRNVFSLRPSIDYEDVHSLVMDINAFRYFISLIVSKKSEATYECG